MKVFLDTGVLLWLLEGDSSQAEHVRGQLDQWLDNGVEFGSSTQTLSELLIHPMKQQDETLQYRYAAFLGELLSIPYCSMDENVAQMTAALVAREDVSFATASQLSMAVVHGFDLFYTTENISVEAGECDVLRCFDTREN